jgi:hypothetical protein
MAAYIVFSFDVWVDPLRGQAQQADHHLGGDLYAHLHMARLSSEAHQQGAYYNNDGDDASRARQRLGIVAAHDAAVPILAVGIPGTMTMPILLPRNSI